MARALGFQSRGWRGHTKFPDGWELTVDITGEPEAFCHITIRDPQGKELTYSGQPVKETSYPDPGANLSWSLPGEDFECFVKFKVDPTGVPQAWIPEDGDFEGGFVLEYAAADWHGTGLAFVRLVLRVFKYDWNGGVWEHGSFGHRLIEVFVDPDDLDFEYR